MLHVGLDIHSTRITICALDERGQVVHRSQVRGLEEMLATLKTCEDKEKMTRSVPAGTVVAHKTGSVDASKTDAGIIYLKSGPVAVCVLTDGNDDKRWVLDNAAQVLIGKIAREVYDHFAEKKDEKK